MGVPVQEDRPHRKIGCRTWAPPRCRGGNSNRRGRPTPRRTMMLTAPDEEVPRGRTGARVGSPSVARPQTRGRTRPGVAKTVAEATGAESTREVRRETAGGAPPTSRRVPAEPITRCCASPPRGPRIGVSLVTKIAPLAGGTCSKQAAERGLPAPTHAAPVRSRRGRECRVSATCGHSARSGLGRRTCCPASAGDSHPRRCSA
jgi:hypothetical protein